MPQRINQARIIALRGILGRTPTVEVDHATPQWAAVIRTFHADQFRNGTATPCGYAVAAVTDGATMATTISHQPLLHNTVANTQALAGLNCFAQLYDTTAKNGGTLTLHVHDDALASLLRSSRASFPHCQFDEKFSRSQPRLALSRAAAASEDKLRLHFKELIKQHQRGLPELTIGTDASMRPGYPGAGIAAMTIAGQHSTAYLSDVRTILEGELAAIKLAIASHPGLRPLRIYTDSLSAASAIASPRKPETFGHAAETLTWIRRVQKKRTIRVEWVRGHNGDPLNEAAHRLAMATRRFHSSNIDQSGLKKITHNIAQDLRAGSRSSNCYPSVTDKREQKATSHIPPQSGQAPTLRPRGCRSAFRAELCDR